MVEHDGLPLCRVHFIIEEQEGRKGTRLTESSDCCPLSCKPSLEECANCSAILPERKQVFISKRTYQKNGDSESAGLNMESRCDLTILYWPDSIICSRGPGQYKCEHFPADDEDENFDYELDYTPECSTCPVLHKSRTQIGLLSQAGLEKAIDKGGHSYLLHLFPNPFAVFPASKL